MEQKQIKKDKSIAYVYYFGALVCLILLSLFCYDIYRAYTFKEDLSLKLDQIPEPNYKMMVKLGWVEVAQPREETEWDKPLGLVSDNNSNVYPVYYSQNLKAGDIGKVFITKP